MPEPRDDERLPAYVVITPVRDEAEHLPRTADAIVAQVHRPARWVLVDDGSHDATPDIARAYAAQHDWISVVTAGTEAPRARGAPIVAAFNRGLDTLSAPAELVVKLDGDISVEPHYFESVSRAFASDPGLGIAGGVSHVHDGTRWVPDGPARNVNGVAKAYRAACLDAIGGLRPSMGWDGIDEYAARARGWRVQVLPELTILHFSRRGSKQPWYRARWEEGVGNHYMGYLWRWLLVRAAYRMVVEAPPVLGGLTLAAAFASARLRGLPQVDDPPARAELRAEQRARFRSLLRAPRSTAAALASRARRGGE